MQKGSRQYISTGLAELTTGERVLPQRNGFFLNFMGMKLANIDKLLHILENLVCGLNRFIDNCTAFSEQS